MAEADVSADVLLVEGFVEILQNLFGRGDRRTAPGLPAVAERIEIAVGADAGILMGDPGTAEAFLALQENERLAGALLLQVIGGVDAGDTGADDQHIEMGNGLFGNPFRVDRAVHAADPNCIVPIPTYGRSFRPYMRKLP